MQGNRVNGNAIVGGLEEGPSAAIAQLGPQGDVCNWDSNIIAVSALPPLLSHLSVDIAPH